MEKDFDDILKAAKQGDAEAQFKLGSYFYHGEVIVLNEQTKEFANYNYYYNGEIVEKDKDKAAEWLHKAAHQGHALAQYKLGDCYRYGEGVEQDKARAIEWYLKAAEQNCVEAEFELGWCYEDGNGVPQDYAKAAEWYTKAAEHSHGGARDYLNELKRTGKI
jgi:TPR repeat protein